MQFANGNETPADRCRDEPPALFIHKPTYCADVCRKRLKAVPGTPIDKAADVIVICTNSRRGVGTFKAKELGLPFWY
jgi:hypothetical protein